MSGAYFKILKTGFVQVGDQFEIIKLNSKNKTISQVYKEKRIENGM